MRKSDSLIRISYFLIRKADFLIAALGSRTSASTPPLDTILSTNETLFSCPDTIMSASGTEKTV